MALDDSAQLVDWDHEQVVVLVIEQRGPTRSGRYPWRTRGSRAPTTAVKT
jgi:hypothetical protein